MMTRKGHCCRLFPLSISHGELALRAFNGEKEAMKVMDMVIPLGDLGGADGWSHPLYTQGHRLSGARAMRYTCRHFDGEKCGNYADRPDMCRDYPDHGTFCEYQGCQCDAVEPEVINGITYMRRKD